MPITVGEISIALKGEIGDFATAMQRAQQLAAQTAQSIQKSLGQSGSVTINVKATGADQASQAIGKVGDSVRQLDAARPSVDKANTSLQQLGEAAKRAEAVATPVLHTIGEGFLRAAEAVGTFAATKVGLEAFFATTAQGTATIATQTTSLGAFADALTNAYRAARFLASPTIGTASGLLAGFAIEKLSETTYSEGGRLRGQATRAGLNSTPITASELGSLSLAGGESKTSDYLSLYNASGGANLRDIAEKLSAIQDPTEKARAAVKIFGDDAGKALQLLNQRFVDNSDRVRDWGLVYSDEARGNIIQFREAVESLTAPFTTLGDIIHGTIEQAKTELVSGFAFVTAHLGEFARASYTLTRGDFSLIGPGAGKDSGPSAIGGLATVLGGAFRGSGHGTGDGSLFRANGTPFLGTADEQFARELQDNVRNNSGIAALNARGKNFPQNVLDTSLSDLSGFNTPTSGIDGIREQLDRLRQDRSKVLGAYFEIGAGGKLQFKDSLSNVEKANATTSLGDVNQAIKAANEQLQAAIDSKRAGDKATQDARDAQLIRTGRLGELGAQLSQSKLALSAAGQPNDEPSAKAAGESARVISEVNAALARHNAVLSETDQAYIRTTELQIATNNAETAFRDRIGETSQSLTNRIQSQTLLNAAIGRGAEATRAANIEAQLAQQLGNRYSDPNFLKGSGPDGISHQSQVDALRQQIGREYDANRAGQAQTNIVDLTREIGLTNDLAAAQARGSQAVKDVTEQYKIQDLVLQGATGKEIALETQRYEAQKRNQSATDLASLGQQLQLTEALSRAQIGGAEAIRQSQLEAKYTDLQRQGASPEVIAATRQADAAEHQREITAEALRTGNAYSDQINSLDQQIGKLEEIKGKYGDSLALEISLKDLENQRIGVIAQESLQLGTATDGLKAYFSELQIGVKSSAQLVHDELGGAFNSVNDSLAKLISGQKVSFESVFRQLSEQTAKTGLQQFEGQLSKVLFPQKNVSIGSNPLSNPAVEQGGFTGILNRRGRPGGGDNLNTPFGQLGATQANPLWVQIGGVGGIAGSGLPSTNGSTGSFNFPPFGNPNLTSEDAANLGDFNISELDQLSRASSSSGGAASLFGNILSKGSNILGKVLKFLPFGGAFAGGGPVDPGQAYLVGEDGPELFKPPTSGNIVPNNQLSMAMAGGGSVLYSIDARGADAATIDQRVRTALVAVHGSAVRSSAAVNAELAKRQPKGRM